MSRLFLGPFIVLLVSSAIVFGIAWTGLQSGETLELGLANIQTVNDRDGRKSMTPGIIVRITNSKRNILSFGISNEAGILAMPLPPGAYCYDAFTQSGKSLQLKRKVTERCFTLKKDEVLTVGIEIVNNR